MIAVECPHCGKRLSIPERYAGQTGKCNACEGRIVVPLRQADVTDTTVAPTSHVAVGETAELGEPFRTRAGKKAVVFTAVCVLAAGLVLFLAWTLKPGDSGPAPETTKPTKDSWQASSIKQALGLLGDTETWLASMDSMDVAAAIAMNKQDKVKPIFPRISDLEEVLVDSLAAQYPNHGSYCLIPSDRSVDYRAIAAILGDAESQRDARLYVNRDFPLFPLDFQVVWYKYDWLEIGVYDGKVVAVQGLCRGRP